MWGLFGSSSKSREGQRAGQAQASGEGVSGRQEAWDQVHSGAGELGPGGGPLGGRERTVRKGLLGTLGCHGNVLYFH